jgi:hypothetical protein
MKTSLFTLTVKVVAVWLVVPDGCCVGRKEGFFVGIVGLNVTGALNASFLEDLPGRMKGFFAGIEELDVGGTLDAFFLRALPAGVGFGDAFVKDLADNTLNINSSTAT